MLVVDDSEYDRVIDQLRSAKFPRCSWSFGAQDPESYKGKLDHIYERICTDYSHLDQNSARFFFPAEQQEDPEIHGVGPDTKVVLLRASYAHISPSDPELRREGNIHYPSASLLVSSFVQTLLKDPTQGMWASSLRVWAISYAYARLSVPDDALDSCGNEEAKTWFNNRIQRFAGGMDLSCTKRHGRVPLPSEPESVP